MEKVINISGKNIRFKCTGGFLIKYKELTGEDPIKSITMMEKSLSKLKDKNPESELNLELNEIMTFYKIIWVLAKTDDKEITNLEDWIDSFEQFPIADILLELLDLIQEAFKSNLSIRNTKKK